MSRRLATNVFEAGTISNMQGEVHYSKALYWPKPAPGHRYRQIVIVESLGYHRLKIWERDILLEESQFEQTENAAVYLHRTLKEATFDAEMEFNDSVRDGWILYQHDS